MPLQPCLVAVLGARMHFAVPRILQAAGILARLFTDLDSRSQGLRWLRYVPQSIAPGALRRLLGRQPAGVPMQKTVAFNRLGVMYALRRNLAHSPSDRTRSFLWANRVFCQRVCRADWCDARAVFTYNTAGLEILERARARGLRTVSEQTIVPSAVEWRLLDEERRRQPGWELAVEDRCATAYSQREEAEWRLADLILCGSEFVREGILQRGGPADRCVVVPYGVERPPASSPSERRKRTPGEPLRVLTIGAVGLRKGTPYVLEAASRLHGAAIFRMVGRSTLSTEKDRLLRSHVECIGSVPRSEVARHYAWADVFLLPSICEGSATVTYEALAHGLPVICTPNAGSVVQDGVEGFVVPIRDSGAIVDRLLALRHDRTLLERLGDSALERSQEFTLERYADRLLEALSTLDTLPVT